MAAKEAASTAEPPLCLPVGRPVIGLLRPAVTFAGAARAEDIRLLTLWRNRFATAFLTEFVATEQRTARWLAETIAPADDRILFMVDDSHGRTVGHMALAFIDWETGHAEVDAVVRGVESPAGLMTPALDAMWGWGRRSLGLTRLFVRVRSDNPSLVYFQKRGFRELKRVPLRCDPSGQEAAWVEDPSLAPGGPALVHLEHGDDR